MWLIYGVMGLFCVVILVTVLRVLARVLTSGARNLHIPLISWVETHGEGNLVRTIDREFKHVRYFSCSALGRVPDGRPEPFTPRGVLAPLAWLLRPYGLRLEASRPAFTTTSQKPGPPGAAEI